MALQVNRVDVWAAPLEDRPGSLAGKLEALAEAGAELEFVIARRTPERKSDGVVFVTPVKGSKQLRAARAAGFEKTDKLHSIRVEAPDKRGRGAEITRALADLDINLRGVSAAALGRRSVCYLAFDSSQDAAKASRKLRRM